MDISSLISSNLEIEQEPRNDLYYGLYNLRVSLHIPHGHFLRGRDHRDLKKYITWRRMTKANRWPNSADVTEQQETDLLDLLSWIQNEPAEFKLVFFSDCLHFYTNDPDLVPRLAALPWHCHCRITQVQRKTTERDVMVLRHPRARYRTYLRERTMDLSHIQCFTDFVLTRDDVRINDSLRRLLTGPYKVRWMGSNHFVEYDDPGIELLLHMIMPSGFRRTYRLEQAK